MHVIKKKGEDIFCARFTKKKENDGKIHRSLRTTKNIESAEYFEGFTFAEKARVERGLLDYECREATPILIERIEKLKKENAKK